METSTNTTNYWNGESVIIGGFTDEGLPILLPPADLEEIAPSRSVKQNTITAAELDEKCNQAEAGK